MTEINLSPRERLLLGLTAAVAIIASAYFLGIRPLSEKRETLEQDLIQADRLLGKYEILLSQKGELVSRHKQLDKQTVSYQKYESAVDMISDIQQFASGLVYLTWMRPVAGSPSADAPLGVEFDCRGELADIVTLIYQIESERRMMRIATLIVSNTSQPGIVRVQVYAEAGG